MVSRLVLVANARRYRCAELALVNQRLRAVHFNNFQVDREWIVEVDKRLHGKLGEEVESNRWNVTRFKTPVNRVVYYSFDPYDDAGKLGN